MGDDTKWSEMSRIEGLKDKNEIGRKKSYSNPQIQA